MSNDKAIIKKETVDVVAARVRQFQESGELHLPANYSAENAMKSAWLILQSTVDRDKKPALTVCTKDSIANALLDMVVQGLNPVKKQGYFIVYGNQLVFQRSYFGTMAVAKQVAGAKEIYAQVVYKDDEFEYTLVKGKKRVVKHSQNLSNVGNDKIVAAYAVIEFDDNPDNNFTDIMTIEQLRKAWSKSKTGQSVHNDFTEEMAKKTVINRACKAVINSSNDSYIMMNTLNRAETIAAEQEVIAEIATNANTETIDIVSEEVPDVEPEAEQQSNNVMDMPTQSHPGQQTLMPTGTDGPDY